VYEGKYPVLQVSLSTGEKRSEAVAYEIEVKDLPARLVATVRVTTQPDRMAQAFGEALPAVVRYLKSEGVEPAGPGFGIFHEYDSQRVVMDVGFPISRSVRGDGRVAPQELDAATFAVTWHHGSYRTIGEAHRAIEAWAGEHGREMAGPPWEVYWEGPESGGDVAAYRTEVGYPIR
jgi:effector-binding domain-containing protein